MIQGTVRSHRFLLGWVCAPFLFSLVACATLPVKEDDPQGKVADQMVLPPVPPPWAGEQVEKSSTGSLWTETSTSLWKDVKACKVGDIVTITVSEKSQASKQATTQTGRSKDFSGDFKFMGLTAGDKLVMDQGNFGYKGKFDNQFQGNGVTSKADSMSTYMTATVTQVLPNGNLVIRGSRWTKVNDELQQIVLEGVVRPNDINRKNEILSQNIADAKIFFVGKGPVTAQQKPGWLMQFLDIVNPF